VGLLRIVRGLLEEVFFALVEVAWPSVGKHFFRMGVITAAGPLLDDMDLALAGGGTSFCRRSAVLLGVIFWIRLAHGEVNCVVWQCIAVIG
jgi:hypothetical protein